MNNDRNGLEHTEEKKKDSRVHPDDKITLIKMRDEVEEKVEQFFFF